METTAWKRAKRHVEIDLVPDDMTPNEEHLLGVIAKLAERIEQLEKQQQQSKGETTRPDVQPSRLNQPDSGTSQRGGKGKSKKKSKKRPGSAKSSKTPHLEIHETVPLHPEDLPAGAVLVDYQDYVVQDVVFRSHNIKYRRARYQLPEGGFITAPLPEHVRGHFGMDLVAHVLYQHHHNGVTQPLIREELLEVGIDISTGQIDRLLNEGHDAFHQEKDELLPAGLEVSRYFHTDDTSARHAGRNGYANHIGNELFATFTSSDTKSRVNFLQVLLGPQRNYLLNLDALFYLEVHEVSSAVRQRFQQAAKAWTVFSDDSAWQEWLAGQLLNAEQSRLLTEATLWAALLQQDVVTEVIVSDDAPQFKIFGFWNDLCWVHAERGVNRLVPLNERQRRAQEQVQDQIWAYYQKLKSYREDPQKRSKVRLEREFDRIFTQSTCWSELNQALRMIHGKKERLLLVLEHPDVPLHNNLAENDIRDYVKKKKISAGTSSDLGRRCRDTFLSLKKTCRKLGVSFWEYLKDRLGQRHGIPPLPDLIRKAAANT